MRMTRATSLLIGVALACLAAELTARELSFTRTVFDPDLAHHVFAPGERFVDRTEGNGTGVWQAKGVRGTPPEDRPSGELTLVLGDSYAEALQVSDEELFTKRLESLLSQQGHPSRIALLGRSGLSVADYVRLAPNYTRVFSPARVIIQVKDDDFAEDAWKQERVRFERTTGRRLRVVGIQEEADPPQHSARWWVRKIFWHSAALKFAVVRLREFAAGAGKEAPLFSAGQQELKRQNVGRRDYPLEEELSLLRAAWPRPLTLLYLPTFNPRDPERKGVAERRLEAAARAQGVGFVNLRESYADFARRGRAPFGFSNSSFNSGHWNAEGHEAAADLLAKAANR